MLGLKRKSKARGGAYTFRVSDVVDVPLRGIMLRLRLVEGSPAMADLGVGAVLQLHSPSGAERRVIITSHATPSGRPTQARLDRVRELDVMISDAEAGAEGPIEIGWMATGPAA